MKKNILPGAVLCLALASGAWAQTTPTNDWEQPSSQSMQSMSPPKILWIYREEVKPAKGSLHEKVESGYARLWEKAGIQPYLGLDALSGANESVFISAYDSFAMLDKDQKLFNEISTGPLKSEYKDLAAQESGLVDRLESSIAVFQPDLSYSSDRFSDKLAKSRYVQVESFHVRPGKDGSFAEGAKMYQEAYRNLGIEDPWLVYRVISGNDAGTYLVFGAMNSMADLDQEFARDARIHQEMGEKMKSMMENANEVFSSMHTNLYRLNPLTSYPPKEFAAADPKFWTKPTPSEPDRVLARTDLPSDTAMIRQAQEALSSLGYSCGTPDGIVGSRTKSALKRFQKENGLSATGVLDRETSRKLGL